MHTRRHTIGWLVAVTLAIPGFACRSAPPGAAYQRKQPKKVACFNARNITSFVPLQGPFLYIRVGNHERYLLTLDRESAPLRLARNIMISPDFDRVCSGARAPMTYEDRGHVGVYDIVAVESVKTREAAEALAKKRTPPSQPQH